MQQYEVFHPFSHAVADVNYAKRPIFDNSPGNNRNYFGHVVYRNQPMSMYNYTQATPNYNPNQYGPNSFSTQSSTPSFRRRSQSQGIRYSFDSFPGQHGDWYPSYQHRPRQSLDSNYTLRDSLTWPLNHDYHPAPSSYCPSSAPRRYSHPVSTAISFPYSFSYPDDSSSYHFYRSDRPTSRAPSTSERYYTAASRYSPTWLFDGIEFSPDRSSNTRDASVTSEYGSWSTNTSPHTQRYNHRRSWRSSPSSSSFSQY